MKKFRNLPAIVTLLAGFIACVIMIKDRYELVGFLWRLVLVMVVFYAFGLLIRVILNVAFKEAEKKKEGETQEDDAENEEDTQEQSSEVQKDKTQEDKLQ